MRLTRGGRLWANGRFVRFWFGQTVSVAGSQVTALALPTIAILVLKATPVQVGLLRATQNISWLLLSVVFGVWLDRIRRRRMLLATDLGQGVVLLLVPLAYVFHALSLGLLFFVGFATGVLTVAFDIAYETYVPALVERESLVEGFSKLQITDATARVAGPAIGGLLIQMVGPARAILADVGSFVVSAVALLTIGNDEGQPVTSGPASLRQFGREMGEGWRAILRSPILGTLAGCSATANLGASIYSAILLLFAYRELHLTPGQIGFALGLGGIAGIAGSLAAGTVVRLAGLGRTLLLVVVLEGIAIMALPAARLVTPVAILTAINATFNLMEPMWSISVGSIRQAVIPDHLRGRITGTSRTIVLGTMPIGAVIGGILGSTIGLTASIFIAGALSIVSGVWLLFGPVIRLKEQPAGPEAALGNI